MQIILTALKLLILGIYIDLVKYFINKQRNLSSKKTLILSKMCNFASLKFIKTELKFKKIADS